MIRSVFALSVLAAMLLLEPTAAPLTAQGLGSPHRLVAEVPTAPEPAALATLSGVALQDAGCDNQVDATIVPVAGTLIQALGENGSAATVVGDDGAYVLSLEEGTYQVEASTPDGHSTVVQVDLLAGSTVYVSFTFNTRDETLLASRGSMLRADGDPNPDTDGNDLVDFADRAYVQGNLGGNPDEVVADITGDLDGDGDIDAADVQIVDDAFGRSVLDLALHYEAEVTPGGSTATIGNGLATVESGEGYTMGRLERTENPSVARFVIEEDRGTATSPELGDFKFSENPADPSYILFDLDTGRVLGGRMTLLLDGGPFTSAHSVDSSIEDGVITMAAGGFGRYQLMPVQGTLSNFATFGTVAFAMCKEEEKKKDKACATVIKPCGVECAVDATCAKNGKCDSCYTVTFSVQNPQTGRWSSACRCDCGL